MERRANEQGLIVAIDGPCGVGKSSLARAVARRLGFSHLDSGALYRAVALRCLEEGVSPSDADAVARVAEKARLEIVDDPHGMRVLSRGEDVTDRLRVPEVSRVTAAVADIRPVRELLNLTQRRFARGRRVVADGRDIATVVFPDAEVKIYLDASLEERARRRFDQHAGDPKHANESLDDVARDIAERDHRDKSRSFGALRQHPEADLLDSTGLPYEETLERLTALVRHAEAKLAEEPAGAFRGGVR
jgi:cytidylate kinase